ncbi:DUF4148 domain-containing protein [Piscinibacter sp. XHJ-5]|uniref:DUF4148 domain-containing protein n=1 Tax=Piscinibacter sp. XHJ-5 TaxID=3037797 RepID=UPI0024530773|nr:DUF4148 domain-containing protein [Piscinibacter sp. XHJ-5]
MNAHKVTLSIVLALATGTAALAQEGTRDFDNATASARTRAEVKAELAQARAAGQLDNRGEAYGGFSNEQLASTQARSQVLADLDVARRAGELQTHNQSYGSFQVGEIRSTRSREQVQSETAAAVARGARLSQGQRNAV